MVSKNYIQELEKEINLLKRKIDLLMEELNLRKELQKFEKITSPFISPQYSALYYYYYNYVLYPSRHLTADNSTYYNGGYGVGTDIGGLG